jgi:glycosidase
VLARLFEDDALYEGGAPAAMQLPTFISNHDMGRFAWFVRKARPKASDAEVLQRVLLAHAMLLTLRGVPVVYYGDEQGYAGTGGDQDARQDMFTSQVQTYLKDRRIGVTPHQASFDRQHPIYREIAELAALRAAHGALRHGPQVVRNYSEKPGLFAVSRLDQTTGHEIVIAFNTSAAPLTARVEVNTNSQRFSSLLGACADTAVAPGSYEVTLAPLDFVVCAAGEAQ